MELGNTWISVLYLKFVILAQFVSNVEVRSLENFIDNSYNTNILKRAGIENDNVYILLDGETGLLSRQERSVFLTDHGYGTRLNAGSNAALLTLGDSVYGMHGPGKRSYSFRPKIMSTRSLNNGARYGSDVDISKFEQGKSYDPSYPTTEDIYGDSDIFANVNTDMFESRVPEKRSDNSNSLFQRLFRSSIYNGDSGYGSRISAGNQVAADNAAYNDLFGGSGIGKRKRSAEIISDFTN